jgi:hypothetical protein
MGVIFFLGLLYCPTLQASDPALDKKILKKIFEEEPSDDSLEESDHCDLE